MKWCFLLLSLLSLPVGAHSFSVIVYAPFSGERANSGEALWNGMRVATRERDGHEGETSDGHLGGVDSHLLRIDSAGDGSRLPALLERLQQQQESLLLVTRQAAAIPALSRRATQRLVVVTQVLDSRIEFPQFRVGGGSVAVAGDFSQRFRDQFAVWPSPEAGFGYLAARLIDAAVRENGENLQDLSGLLEAMENNLGRFQ